MPEEDAILVEAFYRYGYRGREMIAILSPFAMSASASEIIGRSVCVDGVVHKVSGVSRQISGPIQKGEPIGVEIDGNAGARTPPA